MKKKTLSETIWEKTGLSFWHDLWNVITFWEWNWVTFRLIDFELEWDKFDNSLNFEMALLGFNVRWQIGLPGNTKQKKEILKRLEDFEKRKGFK